jgi:hypothetical protein
VGELQCRSCVGGGGLLLAGLSFGGLAGLFSGGCLLVCPGQLRLESFACLLGLSQRVLSDRVGLVALCLSGGGVCLGLAGGPLGQHRAVLGVSDLGLGLAVGVLDLSAGGFHIGCGGDVSKHGVEAVGERGYLLGQLGQALFKGCPRR